MAGANTTIDARAVLATIIHARYGRDITDPLWAKMSPAGAPPDGLRSVDSDDWQITLVRAGERMAKIGYQVDAISLAEAEAVRTEKLVSSVALLVGKASKPWSMPPPDRPSTWPVLLTAAIVVAAVWGAASQQARSGSKPR